MSFQVCNTLTKREEVFTPLVAGVVKMFVCDPTVYDLAHVGHARTCTRFDFVARYSRERGHEVTYAQNIADVDDKVIRRARESGVEPRELAARYEAAYREDMAALRNTSVDVHARALIDRGHAYRLDDGWYSDLSTFPG